MTELNGQKPLTNNEKEEILIQKYYNENFENKEQIGKVNLDRNEVITNMKSATQQDYNSELADKKVKLLSENSFCLYRGQKALKIVAYCSTNYFDMNNPQKGRQDAKYVEALKKDIKTNDTRIKTIVIFGGDLLGTEWQMSYLKNATIKNGIAMYWGLNKRKQRLLYDIKLALSLGAEVYLMQGAQEHKVYKETGRDIMKEIINELNDNKIHYIEEGTSVVMNLLSYNGKVTKNTLSFNTNMIGKAQDSKGDFNASVRSNGRLNADATFVFNGNSAGKYDENYFHVSGQSMFKKTPKGKKPALAPKNYNVFTIYPEADHDLTIVEGSPDNLYSENLFIEKKIYEEKQIRKILAKIAKERFDEQIDKTLAKK